MSANTSGVANRNLAFELEKLTAERDALKVKFDALEKAHRELITVVDGQNRAKIIKSLGDITKLTADEMSKMTSDELMTLLDSYRLLKHPYVNVRGAGDEASTEESRLTVPSKFRFSPK